MSANNIDNPTVLDFRKKNWFWDFNSVFESDLSPYAKLVRLFLARCADNETRASYPSLNTICAHCGISKHTVIKAINELENKKWIKKNIRYTKKSEYGNVEYTSRVYQY